MDRVFEVVEMNPEAEFGCDEGEWEPVALVMRTKDQEKHALTYAGKFNFIFIRKIIRVIRASIMQCSHEVGLSVCTVCPSRQLRSSSRLRSACAFSQSAPSPQGRAAYPQLLRCRLRAEGGKHVV